MTRFLRISSCLVFVLLFFYELFMMYPQDPIVSFPTSLYYLIFVLCLAIILTGVNLSHKDPAFYSFVFLELLTIFFAYEHSFIDPFTSRAVYVMISYPLLLFLFSYNLTVADKEIVPTAATVSCFILSLVYLVDRNTNMGLKDLLSVDAGSYTILYYVPFLMCLKNRMLRGTLLLLSLVTILLSFKRGGIVCVLTGLFVYVAFGVFLGNDWLRRFKKFFFAVLAFAVAMLVFFYINDSFDDILFSRFSQIEERGGSGRTKIYAHVIEMIENTNLYNLLVGHGYNTVVRDNYQGFSAHNDFLECIYDYGMITFVAYIALYINLVRLSVKMLMRKSIYAGPLAASVVMFLLNSLVSHILLYEWFFATFALFWGFVIACDERERLVPLKRAGGVYTDVVYINKEKSNEKGNVGFWNQTGSNQDLSSGQ